MKKLEFGLGPIDIGHIAIGIGMLLVCIFFGAL